MYLLGLDIGSSTIKAALVDAETRRPIASEQYPEQPMNITANEVAWAEQQPEAWWQNLCFVTRRLLSRNDLSPKDIKGIGISYQMHGLVLVDRQQRVLRPAIIWCDTRAASIGKKAFSDLGELNCLNNLLNSPGNFTASKLKWVKDHEPDVYSNIYKVLLPGDFIAMKLTANISTSISGLSEGVFWNFKEKRVAKELLDYFGFDESLLPDYKPTFSNTGTLTREAAIQTGLAEGTPITYRAGDQPNNAFSLNVLHQGEVAATCGTSGVVYGVVNRPFYDPQSRINSFAHVNYEENFDKIGVLLCINGAGAQYSWIKNQIAQSGSSYDDMDQIADTVPIGSEGVCMLPFGNGPERLFDDKNLGAHIFNLGFHRHTRAHLFRAALEGVAFTFARGVKLLKQMGLRVDVIRVANDNMFRSRIFSMTLATLLGNHIEVVDTTGAIGAARAAGVGCGIYNSLEEALQGIQPSRLFEPTLNYALCSQAFSHWQNALDKVLHRDKASSVDLKKFELKNEALSEELREKNQLINTQKLQISTQNDTLIYVSKELAKISKLENTEHLKEQLKKIQQQLERDELTGSRASMEEHFNLLSDDFSRKLKERCPSLSYEELKTCALLRLRLSTKEIASEMNLSIRGAETKRYRLRKKLNLQRGENLIDFLEQL